MLPQQESGGRGPNEYYRGTQERPSQRQRRQGLDSEGRSERYHRRQRRSPPLGAAAFQIQGFTIHSLFRIPVQRGDVLTPLSPDGIRELQLKLEGVAYLVIDEKSMLSLTMLAWLDQHLRQVCPATNTQFFGGLRIVLAGDFFQLPPVRGLPLFDNRETRSSIALSGYCAYCAFDKTIRLTAIVRQSSEAEASFRQTLDAVRMSQVNLANFNTLVERIPSRLPLSERQAFEATAVHLLPTRRLVAEFNYTRLRDTGCLVLPVHSRHSSPSCVSIQATRTHARADRILDGWNLSREKRRWTAGTKRKDCQCWSVGNT